MDSQKLKKSNFPKVTLGLLILFLALIGGGIYLYSAQADGAPATLVYYMVKKADLPITITERGDLQSQSEEQVLCEVADIEGDNFKGTEVQFVVPNGSTVTKGQLLVELNSSGHIERLDRQILATERARSDQITAKVKYENQKTQNKTAEEEAVLQVRLAKLALEEFLDKEGGTFHINLQDVDMLIQEAKAAQLIEENNLRGVERLYELGYRSHGELFSAQLSALKSERALASALSKKKKLIGYQFKRTELELQGKVASSERTLEQVKRDNEALLEQAKAIMDAAEASFKKEMERRKRYQNYVDNCKIHAPQSGMVAYHVCRWHAPIREGGTVQLRQEILSIPDLKRMQVQTKIHESVLDLVHKGLPVTVRIDAFPNRTYSGVVDFVSVLPDAEENSKVYTTVIKIEEEVQQLKPGMTALCEIHVDLLKDVVSVPVQAVQQVKKETWCYVDTGNGIERRELILGVTNEKFIEIKKGLNAGERVVLNPESFIKANSEKEAGISPDQDIPKNMNLDLIEEARREKEKSVKKLKSK